MLPQDARQTFLERAENVDRVAEPEDVGQAFVALMNQDHRTGDLTVVDGGSVLATHSGEHAWWASSSLTVGLEREPPA